jgi:alanine-glyoxylate transaminase/serine-glyoxylate transaminase/serine-pyruvate transaminase
VESIAQRKHSVRSWYLDAMLLDKYWTGNGYHHTSSSTLNYALLEALLLIEEEGLSNRLRRHLENHRALVAGIEAMGLEMLVAPEYRLPSLNAVRIPEAVDDAKLRGYLLETFNLEIGGGLGALKGKVWRVGLMGYNSSPEKILFVLSCLSSGLAAQDYRVDLSAGLTAAMASLDA